MQTENKQEQEEEERPGQKGGGKGEPNNWTEFRPLNTNRELTGEQMRPKNCLNENAKFSRSPSSFPHFCAVRISGNWTRPRMNMYKVYN